jgi:hypothetical protein
LKSFTDFSISRVEVREISGNSVQRIERWPKVYADVIVGILNLV